MATRILGEGNERVVGAFIIGLCIGMVLMAWGMSNRETSNKYPEGVDCYDDYGGPTCY